MPSLRPLLLALPLAAALTLPAAAQSVVRLVPLADLKNLDPVWTTATETSSHGYMIYDVLFALDSKMQPQPQMIDTWSKSPDGMVWKFKLRSGLTFQDGSPVEAKDAVASLRRWAVRMVSGMTLMQHVADVPVTGPLEFEIRLKSPFAPVLEQLSNPAVPLFIMREAEAKTDPFKQIEAYIGSGPFTFDKADWVPGSKVVYKRWAGYKPRPEAPSGLAGGKVAKVDRVEWIWIPDPNIAAQALIAGEVDALQVPASDLLPKLKAAKGVTVRTLDHLGAHAIARVNHLIPPFNNPKVREAMLWTIDQKEYLAAMVGDRDIEKPCWSIFVCGTPLESTAGLGAWAQKPDLAKAKALLAEGGYKGERVVVMDPTDLPLVHAATLMTAQNLKSIGMNVELQATDWSTLAARRPIKDHPDQNRGGWHVFHTTGPGIAQANPLGNSVVPTPCDGKNYAGWPCDADLEKARLDFITADTPEKQKAVVDRVQTHFYRVLPYVILGQFMAPVAYRTELSGVLDAPRLVLWNVEKKS
jgi:peptide/nickel transport system substrate-binding protein